MTDQSYTTSFEVSADPTHVFNCINNVPLWFKDKGYKGSSNKLGDEFTFCYGEGDHFHYSKQKLVEFIQDQKVAWLITESKINWIPTNKEEWTNTKVIFELSTQSGQTILHFTHEGLVPELECYANTCTGWNIIIGDWLFNYIVSNKR